MITVLIYRIDTSYSGFSGDYSSGRYIHVQFDETTKALSVELKGSSSTSAPVLVTPSSGPDLFSADGAVTRIYPTVSQTPIYKQCDGLDLDYISIQNTFPYSSYTSITDSPECVVSPVCDLEISSSYTVTPASDFDASDGAIQVSATSSNGTPKFSLDEDFDYATGTNTTGLFSSLLPGEYTIYSKDELGCIDSILITVPVTDQYDVKYRIEYKDVNGFDSKIDILERGYSGAVTNVNSGAVPFRLEYKGDGNDQYKSIVPSIALITLRSTAGQFEEIFTSDDRKYQVKFYKDLGAGFLLKWMGYCLPEFYSEPYLGGSFEVTITATDGLAELEDIDFLDSNGNQYKTDMPAIKIISEILKTTSLGINIRSCVNIFEEDMDEAATDDPLAQVYVDVRMFYNDKKEPKDMKFVLSALLEPFGARIFQSRGAWWIQRIEYTVQEDIVYREFTTEGVYSSNGTLTTLYKLSNATDTDRAVFTGQSQVRSFIRNYGYFAVEHNLTRDENLIDEGRFEAEDLIEDSLGSFFFKNWNFLIGQPNMSFGLEELPDGTGAFFAKYNSTSSSGSQNDSLLYTTEIPIQALGEVFGIGDKFRIQFDLCIVPYRLMPWVRFAWQVRITNNATGDYYELYPMQGDFQSFEENDDVSNNIYVSEYNTFKKIDLGYFRSPVNIDDGTIKVTLRFHNHAGRDRQLSGGDGYDGVRNIVTVDAADDSRIYWTNGTITRDYRLVGSTEAESVPDRIRPSDYHATDNARQWEKQNDYFVGPTLLLIQKVLIDNFKLSFYPFVTNDTVYGNIQPPETVTYDKTVNVRVKPKYEKTVYLGDVPEFNNSHLIYKGFFRFSDGTPTEIWHRTGLTEETPLLELLQKDFEAQLTNPPRKLSGNARSDGFIDYIFFLKDMIDDRRYMNTVFTLDDKLSSYYLELINVVAGASGEPPPAPNFIELEDGSGFIELEDGSGNIELES
jgi:hypothetical protein